MLEFYCGVPGSGKTYRAVDHVYNSFLDEKNPNFGKYERFYTNINEFNFEYFNDQDKQEVEAQKEKPSSSLFGLLKSLKNAESSVKSELVKHPKAKIVSGQLIQDPSDEIAIELDIDKLIIDLEEIRQLYLSKVSDSELMKRAAELRLSDSLFIIDEAHNYFDTKNDTLIWWLSYHRHLHQDIMLITQSFDLVFRRYLKFSEFYYQAVPSSLRVRGGVFTYNQYVKWQLFKNSKVDSIKIKFNPEVYKLYGSGANTQGKKVILKFIFMGIVLLLVAALGISFFSSSWSKSDSNSTNLSAPSSQLVSPFSSNRSSIFTVACVDFDCSLMGQSFSLTQLNHYKKTYSLEEVETISFSGDVQLRLFARNDKFFKEVLNVTPDTPAAH